MRYIEDHARRCALRRKCLRGTRCCILRIIILTTSAKAPMAKPRMQPANMGHQTNASLVRSARSPAPAPTPAVVLLPPLQGNCQGSTIHRSTEPMNPVQMREFSPGSKRRERGQNPQAGAHGDAADASGEVSWSVNTLKAHWYSIQLASITAVWNSGVLRTQPRTTALMAAALSANAAAAMA
jgi:hypothetical protein